MQAHFASIGMIAPDDTQFRRIFAALLSAKVADFDDAIKPMGNERTLYSCTSQVLTQTQGCLSERLDAYTGLHIAFLDSNCVE